MCFGGKCFEEDTPEYQKAKEAYEKGRKFAANNGGIVVTVELTTIAEVLRSADRLRGILDMNPLQCYRLGIEQVRGG